MSILTKLRLYTKINIPKVVIPLANFANGSFFDGIDH